jgi:hemerythrin superfamily protein
MEEAGTSRLLSFLTHSQIFPVVFLDFFCSSEEKKSILRWDAFCNSCFLRTSAQGDIMLIYESLKKDHDLVKTLLQQLVALSDDSGQERRRLISAIHDALIPHSRAEEAVFYNSIRLADEAKRVALHGYKEHMEAETLLRSLQVEDKLHTGWQSTARKLQEALLHHIAEEEGEVFTAAKSLFTEAEATALNSSFLALKPEIKEEGFMKTTLDMVKNLMPPRFAEAVGFETPTVEPGKETIRHARH